jgi:3'-phosphoadenosine 5'-phosphosulfate sulfotransferase (PAPS reductase)/FAD synthetase
MADQQELFTDIKRKRKRKAAVCIVSDDAPMVVSFSGGRTSAYMLRRLFANTGKERDETLDFVHEIEQRWEVPVKWLEYRRVDGEHRTFEVSYETAHRNSQPDRPFDQLLDWMSVLPNVRGRACTSELKVRTMRRWLENHGLSSWRSAIGIRADESDRAIEMKVGCPSFVRMEFPLIEAGITEADVMAFWKQQPFDLQLGQDEGNCDGCFLKAAWKLCKIEKRQPGTLDWWHGWEVKKAHKGQGGKFREDRTYAGLIHISNHPSLWPEDEDVSCNCMSGGWKEYDCEQTDDTEKPAA